MSTALAAARGIARGRVSAAVDLAASDLQAAAMRAARTLARRRRWRSDHGRLARIARAAAGLVDGVTREVPRGIEREAREVADALRSMRGQLIAAVVLAAG